MKVLRKKHCYYTHDGWIKGYTYGNTRYNFKIEKDHFVLGIYEVNKNKDETKIDEIKFNHLNVLKYMKREHLYEDAKRILDQAEQDDCQTYHQQGRDTIKINSVHEDLMKGYEGYNEDL